MNQPPVKVTAAVDQRDARSCVRCGVSLEVVSGSRHHRQRRRDGGHSVENLVLLCGSGTTGCHGWVHANPTRAIAVGLIVPTWVREIALVPVPTVSGWRRLHADGTAEDVIETVARELMAMAGLIAGERQGNPDTVRELSDWAAAESEEVVSWS